MKKLSEALYEHLSNDVEYINEAFVSSKLREIRKFTSKNDWGHLTQQLKGSPFTPTRGLLWDKIKDEDLIKTQDKKEVKEAIKDRKIILVVDVASGALSCISYGEQIISTQRREPSRRKFAGYRVKPVFRSQSSMIRSIAGHDSYALILDNTAGYGAKELVEKRWLSREDAEAFQANYLIAYDNKRRYENYARNIKALKLYDKEKVRIDGMLKNMQDVTKRISGYMETATLTVSWSLLKDALRMYEKLCIQFKNLVENIENVEKLQNVEDVKDYGHMQNTYTSYFKDNVLYEMETYIEHINSALYVLEKEQKEE